MQALRKFNVLAPLGQSLRVDPLAIRVQRLYLSGARRFADTLQALPTWVPRLFNDWEQTLDALASDDQPWLASRLDPWIKYELFTVFLQEQGHTWQDLRRHEHLFYDLALLNQNYHEFCNPDSPFAQLERAGVLNHRMCQPIPVGTEQEPFVPDTTTRARARARFLREHCAAPSLVMDWDAVYDTGSLRRRPLADPFAQEYGPWEPAGRCWA
jgi:hypothetical protein